MTTRPIIIIGAARSGTNMLRDVLTSLPGLGTWPCDEIPFIWRHNNAHFPSDEFTAQLARPRVKRFIRGKFESLRDKRGLAHVVEKTCANSLRVEFVDAILPEARFLHIIRDGRDVVASAALRWKAPFDARYTLAKARWVPPFDLPYYGVRFAYNRLRKLRSPDGRLDAWGPRFKGMATAVRAQSVEQVSALQWARSVELSERAFLHMASERVFELSYESFVSDARGSLERVVSFLGLTYSDRTLARAASLIRAGSVGKWRTTLTHAAQEQVAALVGDILARRGYR